MDAAIINTRSIHSEIKIYKNLGNTCFYQLSSWSYLLSSLYVQNTENIFRYAQRNCFPIVCIVLWRKETSAWRLRSRMYVHTRARALFVP